jgi:type IV secretion system protein VirD4
VKHPNAAQTFRKFAGYSDRTLSSHASVLGGAGMTLWNNPAVDRATSGNDFSFADLRKRPMSIYVVVNADDIRTLSPLVRLFFGELIATMRSTLPDPKSEPWPVMVMLDEFDQLGPMPIVEQALKQLAGHGARVSIITQSIPGLDNIYGENVRLSLESAAGMKLYLAANDKKTAGEISDALGKTTKLSVSDSVSRDRDFMQRRSVSRRMEERPLLTPDEVRRLNPDQAILIPERQNPLLVHRIVYFQDPTFKKLFDAQKGALPYPPKEVADLQVLTQRMEALERRLAERIVVDFVRPEKAKAEAPVEPEPKLAAEIVAREEIVPEVDTEVLVTVEQAEAIEEPEVDLAALRPPITIAVSKMSKFSNNLAGLEF